MDGNARSELQESYDVILAQREREREREEGRGNKAHQEEKRADRRFSAGNLVTAPCFFPIAVQTGLRKFDLLITTGPARSSLRASLRVPAGRYACR